MKPINLGKEKKDNLDKLQQAIDTAQGKAKVRLVDCMTIIDTLDKVEKHLQISKTAMHGVSIISDPHNQKFPNAYRYTPESTIFEATYKNGSWRITDIRRDTCWQKNQSVAINLTDEAKQAVIERMSFMR